MRLEAVAEVVPGPPQEGLTAVIDLDEAGAGVVDDLRAEGFEGRVIGFFSHVNEELGAAAAAAGADVYPRGRFWRDLEAILG